MASRIAFIILLIIGGLANNKLLAFDQLLHEILEAADQRNSASAVFNRALSGNKLTDQRQALLALGRIGDKAATLKISPFLYSKQPDIRAMAAFALGISHDPDAHKLLVTRLKSEQHPVVISRLLVAIGNIADPRQSIASILPYLNHTDNEVVAASCDALTLAWTFHREVVSIPNSTQVTRLLELSETKQPIG